MAAIVRKKQIIVTVKDATALPITLTDATPSGVSVVLRELRDTFTIAASAYDASGPLAAQIEALMASDDITVMVDGKPISDRGQLHEAAGLISEYEGKWDTVHFQYVSDGVVFHEWVDSSGNIRRKAGSAPSSATDGEPVSCCDKSTTRVGTTGQQYTDPKAAIDAVSGNTSTAPKEVRISAGTYTINNPVTLRDYVSVVGAGSGLTRLVAANSGQPMFIDDGLSNWTRLSGVSIIGGTIGVRHATGVQLTLTDVTLTDQTDTALKQTTAPGTMTLRSVEITSSVAATSAILADNSGRITGSDVVIKKTASTLTNGVIAQGSSQVSLTDLRITKSGGTLTNGVRVSQGSVKLTGASVSGSTNGLSLSDHSTSRITGSDIAIDTSGTYDVTFDSGSAGTGRLLVAAGSWDDEKVDGEPSGYKSSVNVNSVDSRSTIAYSDGVSSGRSSRGRTSYFGQGPPYIKNCKVLRNDNQEVGTWTDITTSMTDHGSGAVAVFGGTTQHRCCYFGSPQKFFGLDVLVDTVLNTTGGSVVLEFWNGSAWTAFAFMTVQNGNPGTFRGAVLFGTVEVQTIRFNPSISGTWATKTLNGTSRYWIRARVSAAITTDGVLDYVEFHPNSMRITDEGATEYLGTARRLQKVHLGVEQVPSSGGAANATVTIGAITQQYRSSHADATDSVVISEIVIDEWMDTSAGLIPTVEWKAPNGGSGNVDWRLSYVLVPAGATESGALSTTTETVSTAAGSANVLVRTSFSKIDISTLAPGDRVVFELKRLGSTDTYADGLQRRAFFVGVAKYREGGAAT